MWQALLVMVLASQAEPPAASPATSATSTNSTAAPATAAPAARFRRVAVYDLQADGIEPRVARFVTDLLVVELRKLDGVSVVAMDEVRMLTAHDANLQLLGCNDGACRSPVGDALGADELLVGTVSVVGGSSVITLRRIDHAAAKATATITRRLVPHDGEEFLAEVGPSIAALYPGRALRAGEVRGVAPETERRLHPPPLPLWAPVTTGAAAVVALGVGAAAGMFALDAEQSHSALLAQAKTEVVPGALVNDAAGRAVSFATAANVAFGAAAAIAIATGVMVPFTNFDNVDAAASDTP